MGLLPYMLLLLPFVLMCGGEEEDEGLGIFAYFPDLSPKQQERLEQARNPYTNLHLERQADNKQIRQAFRKQALRFRPNFKGYRHHLQTYFSFYETLKNVTKRTRYDLFKEINATLVKSFPDYSYYETDFGVFDNDSDVITLNEADYEVNIINSSYPWFINFYNANCPTCRNLVPTWRQLGHELEGIMRIAAVDCQDDAELCKHFGVKSHPTLLYYKKYAKLKDVIQYDGKQTLDAMQEFLLNHTTATVTNFTSDNWEATDINQHGWLLFLCSGNNGGCPERATIIKAAALLEDFVPVGVVRDPDLANNLSVGWMYNKHSAIYWDQPNTGEAGHSHNIEATSAQGIVQAVLAFFKYPSHLPVGHFYVWLHELYEGLGHVWLLCLYHDITVELELQLKRIMATSPVYYHVAMMNCSVNENFCKGHGVISYPSWGVIRYERKFEIHTGRNTLEEILEFAEDCTKASPHNAEPGEVQRVIETGQMARLQVVVHYCIRWNSLCRISSMGFRRAGQHFMGPNIDFPYVDCADVTRCSYQGVQFALFDCSQNLQLCTDANVKAYPTLKFYSEGEILDVPVNITNGIEGHSSTHIGESIMSRSQYEAKLIEAVESMLSSYVENLDSDLYEEFVEHKLPDELWIILYYHPLCRACQELLPKWQHLAKQMSEFDYVKVAAADCSKAYHLCAKFKKKYVPYPAIRLHPVGKTGLSPKNAIKYKGAMNILPITEWLLSFIPSPAETLTPESFADNVLSYKRNYMPWLVKFTRGGAGRYRSLEIEFLVLAKKFQHEVKIGEVDCVEYNDFCMKHWQYEEEYPVVFFYRCPNIYMEVTQEYTILHWEKVFRDSMINRSC